MPPQHTYDTKKIIIFGIIIVIIVAGIGFLIFKKINPGTNGTDSKNLFPYDGTSVPIQTGTTPGTTPIENPISQTPLVSTTTDRLRLITNYPVTSLYPFLQNKIISEPKYDELTKQTVLVSQSIPTNYVRFNAKQNGFLVDAEVTKNIISINQKTDVSLPNSAEVWFENMGNTVVFRSWDTARKVITTFIGSIPSSQSLTYCQKSFTTVLTNKSKGDEVKEFQKYINAKLSLNLTIDGAYGKKASAAVSSLQKLLGLDASGKYDKTLIDAMNIDCTNIIAALKQQSQGIQKLTGDFIDTGIIRGTISPNGTQIFYLKTTNIGVVGTITDSLGKNPRKIFSSPFTEWKPQWVNETTIAMTTLASSDVGGYLYFLNPTTGSFQKVLGPINGLTTLTNPTATTVLFGRSQNKKITLSTYDVGTGAITIRDLATLPEKCTWGSATTIMCAVPQSIPTGQYPDDWYQGNVMFNDAFWSLDTIQNSTTLVTNPTTQFDAYQLTVSPDGSYFYFINKIDGGLWSYRLGDN